MTFARASPPPPPVLRTGLSALRNTEELGRVCGFEPGECRLCWAGAFPSFIVSPAYKPVASWKILDAVAGVLREGTYDAATLGSAEYKKPSDSLKLPLLNGEKTPPPKADEGKRSKSPRKQA